jgi:endonuclease/exonuclease/phosphatase family metal-dependent hydrolase
LAILSPHPIVDHKLLRLSRDPGDPRDSFQRLVLGAQIRTAAGPFWLFNTHFPLSAAARERVVAEALSFVRQTAGETPFLFTGDFNAEPEDPPIQFLHQQPDLKDAWIECHPDDVGYTFPAWGPEKRIDYAFVPQAVPVLGVEIVGQVESRKTVSPSDHCGLLVTLKL